MKRIALMVIAMVLAAGIGGCSLDDSAEGVAAIADPSNVPQVDVGILTASGDDELQVEPTDGAADIAVSEDDDADAEAEAEESEGPEDAPEPLIITTDELPSATANRAYTRKLIRAHGGNGAYIWEVEGLPEGMVVRCNDEPCDVNNPANKIGLKGTPTVVGSFALVVRATDANDAGVSAERGLSIEVEAGVAAEDSDADGTGDAAQAVQDAAEELAETIDGESALKVSIKGLKNVNAHELAVDPSTGKLLSPSISFTVLVEGATGAVELIHLAKEGKAWVQDPNTPDFKEVFQCAASAQGMASWNCRMDDITWNSPDSNPSYAVAVRACVSGTEQCADDIKHFTINYVMQNLNQFTVHACRMIDAGIAGKQEECMDYPPELTLKFYQGDTLMAVYNENGFTAGNIVPAAGQSIVKADQIDRITAYQRYSYGQDSVSFTKITIASPIWQATYDISAAPQSFVSLETDIMTGMPGYDEDAPEGVWKRIGR